MQPELGLRLRRQLRNHATDVHSALLLARLAHGQTSELRRRAAADLLRVAGYDYTSVMSVSGFGSARAQHRNLPEWRMALLCASLLGFGLGCGGRTSVLDDSYSDPGSSSLGGSKAGKPPGGATATDRVAAGCKGYCRGYARVCPEQLTDQACNTNCKAELDRDSRCLDLGLKFVSCIEPLFEKGEIGCEQAVGASSKGCEREREAFRACVEGSTAPGQPPPPPPPQLMCGGTGSGGLGFCQEQWACEDGVTYATDCKNVQGSANCLCIRDGDIAREVGAGTWSASACRRASKVCGFPDIGAPPLD